MTNVDLKYVADNIRRIRESLFYSQEYMGAKLGICQNGYSKIELGKSKITLDRLLNIATLLETDVHVLLKKETVSTHLADRNIEMVA